MILIAVGIFFAIEFCHLLLETLLKVLCRVSTVVVELAHIKVNSFRRTYLLGSLHSLLLLLILHCILLLVRSGVHFLAIAILIVSIFSVFRNIGLFLLSSLLFFFFAGLSFLFFLLLHSILLYKVFMLVEKLLTTLVLALSFN